MKFTDVIDTILQSDPDTDWYQVPGKASEAATYLFLPDINLRVQQSDQLFDLSTGRAHVGELDPAGTVFSQPFHIYYGASHLGSVPLYWFYERDRETGRFAYSITYLPIPLCGPDSCEMVCRLAYQIARIIDLLGKVDQLIAMRGYVVEDNLTGRQYLDRLQQRQRNVTALVLARLAQRSQEEEKNVTPTRRHIFRRSLAPAAKR